jgi:hypothetical protein
MVAGLKLIVTPVGCPEAVKATAPLKPPETELVIVLVPEAPGAADTEPGAVEIVKAGTATEVTVSVTFAV